MSGDVVGYSALGVVFSVASDNVDVLEMIDRLYVHCRTSLPPTHAFEIVSDAHGWALGLDGVAVLRDAPESLTLERMAWEVNQIAWASAAPGLFVHAGAVILDDVGVMLCAGSARGKSTLTMGLCERGARYLSDEIAVIDVDSGSNSDDADAAAPVTRYTMTGFARPIALRHGSWPLVGRFAPNSPPQVAEFMDDVWFVVPPDMASSSPIDVIAFPIYDAAASDRIEPITVDEATAIIGDQAPNLARLGPLGIEAVASLVESATTVRLVFSDLEAACALLREVAAAAAPSRPAG